MKGGTSEDDVPVRYLCSVWNIRRGLQMMQRPRRGWKIQTLNELWKAVSIFIFIVSLATVYHIRAYTSPSWVWGGLPFCREPNRTIIAHRKVTHSRTRGVRNARILVRHIVTSHPVQTLWINCTYTHAMASDLHFESRNCTLATIECC